MTQKTLEQVVSQRPFPDYAEWWPMGPAFTDFMAEAMVSQWSDLHSNDGRLDVVQTYVATYVRTVYGRQARASLVDEFAGGNLLHPLQSGEFDALSYAFYRSAFELIERDLEADEDALARERRAFTRRVGRVFFYRVQAHLGLDLPKDLGTDLRFRQLKDCIGVVGAFLQTQGYLRDHFGFRFAVDAIHAGRRIVQDESQFLKNLSRGKIAYAVYEMGYPVILPSAVYLYHTVGEAQHHSSRTIEELFERVGCQARETPDFDPMDYPSDMVVELWEIRQRRAD